MAGDDIQFSLSEITISKIGKKKGEEVFSLLSYYSKFENVLNRIVYLEIVDFYLNRFIAFLYAITGIQDYIRTLVLENFKTPDLGA